MFDLHRLRLLRELKHRGTLAAVATALSYSPSSVSQQLSQLEVEVGVPLLEPIGRRVRLTAQAEILVAHVEAVLTRLAQAEADIAASLETITGTLRVASFQTAMLALMPRAMHVLRDSHPGLRIELVQAEPEGALGRLRTHDYDVVLAEEYPGDPQPRLERIEQEDVCQDGMRLACPSGVGAATVAELARQPWVMEPTGTGARQWAMSLCRHLGFEPDVRFETTDLVVQARFVEQGLACALLPDLVWVGRAPTELLRPLPGGPQARRVFTAVREGSGEHPAVRVFRHTVRDVAATTTPRLSG